MNSLDRIKQTVGFGEPDRTPVLAQVFGHAATFSEIPLSSYLKNGELVAECQTRAQEHYGYDAVFAFLDILVEAEALGTKLRYQTNAYPVSDTFALSNGIELDELEFPDPTKAGRMPEQLTAARSLREKYSDEVAILGCVAGPMTLATQLLGMDSALYMLVDEPAQFSDILDLATEVAIEYGTKQIEMGTHLTVVGDPSASQAVIPPKVFREFVYPRIKKIMNAFIKAGALANCINIPGPTSDLLQFYPDMGVHVACIDYYVDASKAREALPKMCLAGNIKSLFFIEASPEEVGTLSQDLLSQMSDSGGFILASGFEIPPDSKPENIKAMVQAAQ